LGPGPLGWEGTGRKVPRGWKECILGMSFSGHLQMDLELLVQEAHKDVGARLLMPSP
jgi:hypothetical protein